jgi:serine/threonine-protein kinase RsbW
VKRIKEQSISVPASTAYISAVRDFVGLYANQFGFNDREVDEIRLAVDEAYTNVIKHAYQYDENQRVLISIGGLSDEFWISITDQGRAFNPELYSEPDIKERIRLKKRGGVGVYLIRKLMDAVEYSNMGGTNEIKMTKRR